MIKKIIYTLVIAVAIFSCNNGVKKNPVTDTDVATAFIRAVLDNDFTTAEKYLLKDETNQQFFTTFERLYHSKGEAELGKFKSSDIIINTLTPLKDTTIVNYSNTYEKDIKTNLRLVRSNGVWLVDLKYTFPEKQ